jgi:hypothetical protein
MANFFYDQIISDSNKRAVIKCLGLLDGSGQETANVKIQGMNLRGALAVDANNMVTVAMGGTPRTNYRANVARIAYNVNIPSGYLKIDYSGTTICNVAACAGQFDLNIQENMGSFGNPLAGATGNLLFTTVGAGPNNSYTVIIDIHKNGLDYDQGQITRPNDFGVKPFGVTP